MSIYCKKLVHVQVVIKCPYLVAQMCTRNSLTTSALLFFQERMLHCIFESATIRQPDPEPVLVDGGCISAGHCTRTGQDCQESSGNNHLTTFCCCCWLAAWGSFHMGTPWQLNHFDVITLYQQQHIS